MTVNVATNRWATSNFIVAPTIAEGAGYTTVQAAINAASAGSTVFLKPGTYTENLTLKAGVNLVAYDADAYTPNVTIIGKCSFSAAGTVSISGIRLQTNSDYALEVTGSAASVVNLTGCYLNGANNSIVHWTSSSASSLLFLRECYGDLNAAAIAVYVFDSAGNIRQHGGTFFNTSGSTAANTFAGSGGFFPVASALHNPCSFSGTSLFNVSNSVFNCTSINTTALTYNSTGTGSGCNNCIFSSGTASTISVGAGATFNVSVTSIKSTNTNAVTGAGTVTYGLMDFVDSSSTVNTTTQTPLVTRHGISRSTLQPAFLARHSVAQNNVTGNGTVVTVNFTNEIFDQNSNYDGTNTFTAPVTGLYQFNAAVYVNDAATSTFGLIQFLATTGTYLPTTQTPFPLATLNQYQLTGSLLINLTAGNTVAIQVAVNGMAGATADLPAAEGQTYFSGFLVC